MLIKTRIFLMTALAIFVLASCNNSNEDDLPTPENLTASPICGVVGVIDDELFQHELEVYETKVYVESVQVNDDCATITYAVTVCGGEISHVLVAEEAIIEGDVKGRNLRVFYHLSAAPLCDGLESKALEFDLRNFQIEGETQVLLHLDGWDEGITYRY